MKYLYGVVFYTFLSSVCFAEGALSDYIRITSNILGYDLQYQVYTPEGFRQMDPLPTIYVTDGPGYIHQGKMVDVLDSLIDAGQMKPVIAVFIDARNPDNLKDNRRNFEYLCSEDYAKFFKLEFIPTIEENYPASKDREDRVIQGVSFGGLNAACFGLMLYDRFSGISMHSPANNKFLRLIKQEYKNREKLPLKMFMSFGRVNDNLEQGKPFKLALTSMGYDLTYRETGQSHNWKNWRPLIDDALLTFFAK